MEDIVPEAENLFHPPNHSGDEANEERQNPEAAEKIGNESDMISDEEKGGELLDHIISMVTPSSPKAGNNSQGKVEAFESESEEEVGGGGLINNIVSNLFHHSEGVVVERKEGMVKVGEDENKAEEGGAGIIDNIVSNLPKSLPDDAAPTSDEATILIHIVQD